MATSNPGKIREFRRILDGVKFELVTPASMECVLEVTEDGATYEENAAVKARAYAGASGVMAIADDSGIEVDALGGRPGLYSARYGGPGLDDPGRTDLLLRELENVPDAERSARYVAVIAIAGIPGSPAGHVEIFRAVQEGRIGHCPRGSGGFGYDPIFVVEPFEKLRTEAELSDAEKDRISHRGQALRLARRFLEAER